MQEELKECEFCKEFVNVKTHDCGTVPDIPTPCPTCSTLQERLLTLEQAVRLLLPEGVMNAVGLDADPTGAALIEAAKNTRATDPLLEKMVKAATHLLANPAGVDEWQDMAMVMKEYQERKDAK